MNYLIFLKILLIQFFRNIFANKEDQVNLQMVIETIQNEIFINSFDELILFNLKNLGIPFTLNHTTYHEVIVLLLSHLQSNNFNLNRENLEVLQKKIEKLNKNFDRFIKTIEEKHNDNKIWSEYDIKVNKTLKFTIILFIIIINKLIFINILFKN